MFTTGTRWCKTNETGRGVHLVNHMKDIHEVKDNQSLSFNHVRCRGVAARAGSVHLICSMNWKLGCKGGARTHPQQHHPVAQGGLFSKKFRQTTGSPGSPQTMPIVWQSLDNTKRHTMTSMAFHYTPTTTTQPTTCVGGANPPQQPFTIWQPFLTVPVIPPGYSTSLTVWAGLEDPWQANGGA